MDEWSEDIVSGGSSYVYYGHLTFSLRLHCALFLALSRGSECMPIDSRTPQPRPTARILVVGMSRQRSQRWRDAEDMYHTSSGLHLRTHFVDFASLQNIFRYVSAIELYLRLRQAFSLQFVILTLDKYCIYAGIRQFYPFKPIRITPGSRNRSTWFVPGWIELCKIGVVGKLL